LITAVTINGIKDNAKLSRSKGGYRYLSNNSLVHIRDVGRSILVSYQPLFSDLPGGSTYVIETLKGFKVKSLLRGQNVGLNSFANFFVYIREISSRNTNKPLFTSFTGRSRSASLKTKSLVRLNNDGPYNFYDLHLNARDVGTRTFEQPLITSLLISKVSHCSQAKSGVRSNDLERRNFAVQGFARIQGKRFGNFDSNFFVTVAQGVSSVRLDDNVTIVISNNRVLNEAKMARGNQDHGSRSRDNRFMFLSRKGLRTDYNASHISVVV
jgi:hypothetical protein